MEKHTTLKLIGMVILTMIILIILSVIEVAIYSYLINPGQPDSFYEKHATKSAPYISGIFGFIIFFLVVRYWKKKGNNNITKLAVLYPLTYILLDLVILAAASVDWSSFFIIFLLANGAKFLGSFTAYKFS